MKSKHIAALIATCLFIGSCYGQPFNATQLDSFLLILEQNNKAMGSVAVASNGNTIYTKAIGYSQIDPTPLKSTPHTTYRIGSVSKMFTAVMILQATETSTLKLNTTLDAFYPQVPNAAKISIEDLLSHRSGIHNFTNDPEYPKWMTAPKTKDEMIRLIASYPPDFPPNEKTAYSNANFVLLGYILEDIYKQSYAKILDALVCQKIGLKHTYYGSKTDVNKGEALSYQFQNSWIQLPETDMSIPGGAGGIVSTPEDLNRFIYLLFQGNLISPENINRMKNIREGMGLGMQQFPYENKRAYGHGGAIDGFNTLLCYFPDEKLAVAYCSNGNNYSINDITLNAIYAYFQKPIQIPIFTSYTVVAKDLDQYAGTYSSSQLPLKLKIFVQDDQLMGQGSGQPSFPLTASAPNEFKYEIAGIFIRFNPETGSLELKQGGGVYVFSREK